MSETTKTEASVELQMIKRARELSSFATDSAEMASHLSRMADTMVLLRAIANGLQKDKEGLVAALKSWHDNIASATGGHAATPEAAREVVKTLRDELDRVKAAVLMSDEGEPIEYGETCFVVLQKNCEPFLHTCTLLLFSENDDHPIAQGHGLKVYAFKENALAALAPAQEKHNGS